MPSGGARNRSGPAPDPASVRSAKRGLAFRAISPKPFRGKVPEYPLPQVTLVFKTIAGPVPDEKGTEAFRARELELWAKAWKTYPAAHVWAAEPWRHDAVADWVRISVRCEAPDITANLLAQKQRFADEALVSTRGLTEAGYTISATDPEQSTGERRATAKKPTRPAARTRKLRIVSDEAS